MMIKQELREQGYVIEDKIAKKYIVNILWTVFTLLIIAGTVALIYAGRRIFDVSDSRMTVIMDSGSIPMYFVSLIFFLFLYFALKFILTFLFCYDRYDSIKLKSLEENKLPVCHCREALSVQHTVLIYIIPVIIVYISVFLLSTTIHGLPFEIVESGYMTMLFFLSFFMAFDLTLVAYVLCIKIKHKIDYVAANRHVYQMTLYTASYVRIGGKTLKNNIKAEKKPRKRMLIKITACLNSECSDYAKELEKNTKLCPSCGADTYISEVLPDMATCVEKDCPNFGQELKQEAGICSSCGAPTKPVALVFNPRLTMPAIALSLSCTVLFPYIFIYMTNYGIEGGPIIQIFQISRIIVMLASIVMGFLSKSKAAVVIAIACLPMSTLLIAIAASML
jgi:hypothetical protein